MTLEAQATSSTHSQKPLIAAGWFAIVFVRVVSSLVTLGQSLCCLAQRHARHSKALCNATALCEQPFQSDAAHFAHTTPHLLRLPNNLPVMFFCTTPMSCRNIIFSQVH